MSHVKAIEREFPMEGECEECGTMVEDGISLTLNTAEVVLVFPECEDNFELAADLA